MPNGEAVTHQKDWWVTAGLAVSAASAAVSSFAGLHGLALVAGWPPRMAPLLPITIDSLAAVATRIWLAPGTCSARARRFARANSVGALGLSLMGNAIFHLIATGLLVANWMVVVAVGAVPALVLGLVSHLAVLRAEVDPAGPAPNPSRPEAGPSTDSGRVETGPKNIQPYRTDEQLTEAARAANGQYRLSHGGRPIPRDELRRTLRVGGGKATELLRRLKAEDAKAAEVNPPA
ncbi:DUF2637 domain-containing protein [Catenulispora rubra]|uniref:DUF2637 domain-containing protein n=1 Tax=Catenulispora rubra TaxID=280293 RepID=UPI0018928595|nr:DUF2637 domain-containing protein [Catenulispora rubra]